MHNLTSIANPWVAELPVYEPGRPIEEVARELELGDVAGIIKLASNENALGPSPKAVKAMTAAAGSMHRYPDGSAFYLRRGLAARLGVEPDEVILGNGSNELIELLAHAFLSPGAGVVVADRAFVVYRLVATAFCARTVSVPMQDLTHDLEAMAAAIDEGVRLVFVSNPNNPTGTMVEAEALDRFMEHLPGHAVAVIDEAYIEMVDPARRPDTLRYVREQRNVFVLRTFSKAYGLAGLRLGYAVGPAEGITLLHKVRQPFNANAMAQAAALAALEDTDHVQKTCALVRDGLACLGNAFDRMGLDYVPSAANFMLVRVGEGRKVFEQLMRRGVIVRPMEAYGLPEYVRVTVGTAPENERLVDALEDVVRP